MKKRLFGIGRMWTCLGLLFVAAWLSPCVPPRPLRPMAQPAPAAIPHLPRQVWVLLTAQENQASCQVLLPPSGSQGASQVEFRIQGRTVHCSDGRQGDSLRLSPRGPFEIAGRQYLGNLKVQVHDKGGLRIQVEVALEHYVEGVVSAELPLWSSLPAELEAQSIAVRTYTVAALDRQGLGPRGFLWDGVQDQAYHGNYRPGPSRGEQSAAVRLRRAVEATRGQVLLQGPALLDVRYHASCGGNTADRSSIFPGTAPSAIVACEPCKKRADQEAGTPAERRPVTWKLRISKPDCLTLVHRWGLGKRLLKFGPAKLDAAGRWQTVRLIGDHRTADVPLDLMRKHLGYAIFKSGRILSVQPASGTPNAEGLILTGVGRGHGVGLCQEGIHDYAAQGMGSQRILEHYYPGSRVERLGHNPRF